MNHLQKRRAFTLIEVLVVLGIVALLAAILFPAFNSARGKARQASCQNNLHQIGLAISLYAQDSDGKFPRGGDPVDLTTNLWDIEKGGVFRPAVNRLQPLPVVVSPYLKTPSVWICPSDFGFKELERPLGYLPDTYPSAYQKFGMSYLYRTELALENKNLSDLVVYDDFLPYSTYGPDQINVLADMHGAWHGSASPASGRLNVLFADGHVKALTADQYGTLWTYVLNPPQPAP